MSDANFSVASQPGSPDYLVTASGEIDIYACEALRQTLLDALAQRPTRVVVDMAGVTFIDSSGISVFIAAHKRGESSGTELVLRAPTRQVVRVLQITGLDTVLTVVREPSGEQPPAGG